MKKQIKAHEERNVKSSAPNEPSSTPLPQYILDRSNPTSAKALSSAIKNKRSEKAARFSVPLPKVKGISEQEMFKVVKVCTKCLFIVKGGNGPGVVILGSEIKDKRLLHGLLLG
jgi:ribosome biogenesis protein NSA2